LENGTPRFGTIMAWKLVGNGVKENGRFSQKKKEQPDLINTRGENRNVGNS